MFTFLYGEMQDGYVSLDADMTQTLEDAYSQITNAKSSCSPMTTAACSSI